MDLGFFFLCFNTHYCNGVESSKVTYTLTNVRIKVMNQRQKQDAFQPQTDSLEQV